jgi:hypothetical protein
MIPAMLAGAPANLTYGHDRRKHRHRCRACWKTVDAGQPVIMAKVKDRKTWVIHEACGDKRHSETYSWREVMAVWAAEHLKRLG